MNAHALCAGLGMRACYTCHRNVDNNPGVIEKYLITPAAYPPGRCIDWLPPPVIAFDAPIGGL